ncbi:hypothetical protein EDD86DRAFT_219253 [Gorgonomyces haynaldii]|nr:hypothetical protein EDD86DRAFT_219253 [Gorgonomyces haynaldii]
MAVNFGHVAIASYLLQMAETREDKPVHLLEIGLTAAGACYNTRMLDLFLDKGAHIDGDLSSPQSPLTRACQYLIERGASLFIYNTFKKCPVIASIQEQDTQVTRF